MFGTTLSSWYTGSDGLGYIYIQEQKQNGMVGTTLGQWFYWFWWFYYTFTYRNRSRMGWLGPPWDSGSTGSDGLGYIYIQEQKQNEMVGTILGSGSTAWFWWFRVLGIKDMKGGLRPTPVWFINSDGSVIHWGNEIRRQLVKLGYKGKVRKALRQEGHKQRGSKTVWY